VVGKIGQPRLHHPVRDGTGQQYRDGHVPEERLREQRHETGHGGAQHLANADLLRAELGHERDEPVEPEARQQQREARKSHDQPEEALIFAVQLLDAIVEERVVERHVRSDSRPIGA